VLLQRFGARHSEGLGFNGEGEIDHLVEEGVSPESAYDQQFAHALVERALEKLRSELGDASKDFALIPLLLDRGDQGELKCLSLELGVAHDTLRQRLRRLRLRLRQLLRDEFAELVADPKLIDEELLAIKSSLA